MARNGHRDGIVQLPYESQLHRSLPVEVLVRTEVLARYPEQFFTPMHRHAFHVIVLCTAGSGRIGIDFDDVDLREGSLVRVRPGQLIQHYVHSRFEALWVVYPDVSAPPDVGGHQSDASTGPRRWDLPAPDADVIKRIML
ncbi:MAG: AraC family ligand binding domain-containing protein, partial [Actinobacteria bacterium]|nr:AraC family ligand binding domain-containing protein [Actinomycetota bacterium]